ncbi:hypothetical protein Y013_22495 [Rhodococcus pyridinivorans SB3094]|uniref:Uncharacterized protein n=2 Tax=Nocardiaceae TaxID=85025 RepID=V9XNF8_9NOCA|nr:hypothetical protein Y013_22495 [Rhodococcus pyridinivorans SB3094]
MPMTDHPTQMRPHRQVRLLAGQDAILDGQIPRPTVGQVGVFWLLFDEVPADPHDPTLSTIDADAEPLAPPRLEPAVDAPATMPRSWVWRILLRGDGWSATWYSRRPATGCVRLTGRFVGDFAYATTGSVRGRVTSARNMNEAASAGRHEPGILADLDLDDVPPLPIRPSIIPRAISAAGLMLWAADEQLPLIARIDLDHPTEARPFVLPAPIAPQPGSTPWRLHADPEGCWIAGWYGIFRISTTGAVQRRDDRRVDASAAHEGTLLTCTHEKTATRIGLWHPDGQSHHDDTTVPAGTISAVTAYDDGFRILMRQRDTWPITTVVVAAYLDGHVTVGPPLDEIDDYAVLTPEPAAIIDLRGTIRTLHPDLHTEPPARWPLPGLSGGTVGTHIWVEHHDPDRDLHDNRRYWLLSLTDSTGKVISRTEIHTPTPDVTLDGHGTVWITDNHAIIAVHTPTGTLPPPITLAELLTHHQADPPRPQ